MIYDVHGWVSFLKKAFWQLVLQALEFWKLKAHESFELSKLSETSLSF